jgi:hypothetical protein
MIYKKYKCRDLLIRSLQHAILDVLNFNKPSLFNRQPTCESYQISLGKIYYYNSIIIFIINVLRNSLN